MAESLPSRGAWIEIDSGVGLCAGRTSRSPHGERGLKWTGSLHYMSDDRSLPSRGAWIEMIWSAAREPIHLVSLPSRGAWIEIAHKARVVVHSARRSPHGERGLK